MEQIQTKDPISVDDIVVFEFISGQMKGYVVTEITDTTYTIRTRTEENFYKENIIEKRYLRGFCVAKKSDNEYRFFESINGMFKQVMSVKGLV